MRIPEAAYIKLTFKRTSRGIVTLVLQGIGIGDGETFSFRKDTTARIQTELKAVNRSAAMYINTFNLNNKILNFKY